jgi:hypothetical protein
VEARQHLGHLVAAERHAADEAAGDIADPILELAIVAGLVHDILEDEFVVELRIGEDAGEGERQARIELTARGNARGIGGDLKHEPSSAPRSGIRR